MNKKIYFQHVSALLLLLILALCSPLAFSGSNFTITPAAGYPFPSTINTGQTVSAYYSVTNNTRY